jgi:hypothetical protein
LSVQQPDASSITEPLKFPETVGEVPPSVNADQAGDILQADPWGSRIQPTSES